jgi:ferredoxin
VRGEPGVAVATALREAGFDILTSCSRGVCGTCETRLLGGEPDHRDSILDDDERADSTTFFPCVSRARSDRLILAL